MKKYLIIIIIFLVGCSNQKKEILVCNNQDTEITFNFENNKSINYQKVTHIKLNNNQEAMNYKNDDYDKLEVVDNIVNMYIDEKIDDMNIEEVKSLYEKSGYNCKKKSP